MCDLVPLLDTGRAAWVCVGGQLRAAVHNSHLMTCALLMLRVLMCRYVSVIFLNQHYTTNSSPTSDILPFCFNTFVVRYLAFPSI